MTAIMPSDWEIRQGDALALLRAMPSTSVQCVVTSPPYYGLRDYGLPPTLWPDGWSGCLGLEPSPSMFLEHLVSIFREVRRVLRDDGTCWVNLGDSYAGSGKGPTGHNGIGDQAVRQGFTDQRSSIGVWSLKPKDLMMMPARFAIAMVDDGWWLRSEITWCKTSAMPESVTDRPTAATERLYLFSKSARYYYDAGAVREPLRQPAAVVAAGFGGHKRAGGATYSGNPYNASSLGGANLRNYWLLGPGPSNWDFCHPCGRLFVGTERQAIQMHDGQRVCPGCGASDWTAHYAAYPTTIPRRGILAGSSDRGACPACGAPWVREVVATGGSDGGWVDQSHQATRGRVKNGTDARKASAKAWRSGSYQRMSTGWRPSCACGAGEPVSCVILDPFSGSGTTGQVARQLNRHYIGLELSERYARASEALLSSNECPLLALAGQASSVESGSMPSLFDAIEEDVP